MPATVDPFSHFFKIYHVRAIQTDSVQELVIFDFRKEEEKRESNNCPLLIMAYMTTQVND